MADNVHVLRTSMDPVLYSYARAANGHFFPREHIKKLETERKDILEKRIEEERKRIELTEGSTHKTRKVSKESEEIRKHIEKLEQERENTHVLHRELTPNGNTILHVAVQFGHVENVRVVLEERPHLVLEGNKKGETPLHMAARDGLADIVKELILGAQRLEGGDLDVKKMLKLATNGDKDTALHMAARNCHLKENEYLKVVKLLLKKAEEDEYWDPDFQHPCNNVGETPLYLVVERGKKGQKIVLELLKTCNSQDHYSGPGGRTALHAVAFHYKDSQVVKELLTPMEGLINQADANGWTPLQYAACSGNALVIEELLKLKPDCWEMVDKNGQNILHIAVSKNMKSAIDYIMNKDWLRHLINQKNVDGDTPLHLLVASDYKDVDLWNRPEADKHVFNNENFTPIDLVWYNFRKTATPAFAAAYIQDEDFLGSEIDGGRIIACQEHENLAKFKRFKEEGKIKEENKKKEKEEKEENKKKENKEKDAARKKKQIEARKASVTVYESLVIVAALIATISSAAAFAIPGGYDGNQGRDQGMAVLARIAAFKAFVITNTIALASSVTSILLCLNALYYYSISNGESEKITQRYKVAGVLILVSIFFLMLAFITAAFAVLPHSLAFAAFAVSTCIIVCIGFIVLFSKSLEMLVYQLRMAKDKQCISSSRSHQQWEQSHAFGSRSPQQWEHSHAFGSRSHQQWEWMGFGLRGSGFDRKFYIVIHHDAAFNVFPCYFFSLHSDITFQLT